jgi:glycosyltransferase involved in cell wall biosynthesis
LKWKRLELFLEAISQLNRANRANRDTNKFFANICYIKPVFDTYTNVSALNKLNNTSWYEDPKNLNDIRAKSSIFISTAKNEPFGLSILESMATGLAIVIPADNAYWDQQLTDGYNCLKYDPDNIKSLVEVLTKLINTPELLANIAKQAQQYAFKYCGSSCYVEIINSIKGE